MTLDSEMLLRALRMLMLACLGSLAVFLEAAPVDLSATGLLSPDLLLCVVAYWALRRPSATPLLLVFGLGLGRDLLTDAPLGAGALTLVLTAEILKQYRGWLRTRPFLV
ncbi:MAG: rod shape-determining protein MreD, partial [Pseudomonadota bacterium]